MVALASPAPAASGQELGPFAGRPGLEYACDRGVWSGSYIVSPGEACVFGLFREGRALSARQVEQLGGRREYLRRLAGKGCLDVYRSDGAPPVYAPSEAGADMLGVEYALYSTVELLRVVAANQLWVRFRALWPDAGWACSPSVSVFSRGSDAICVIAPRSLPGEDAFAWKHINSLSGSRLVVVASCPSLAAALAWDGALVRYTWDAVLRDGLVLYRWAGGAFVPDFASGSGGS